MKKLLDGYMWQCHTFGHSGFATVEAAKQHAAENCSADNITFLKYEAGTLSHHEEFAWAWPPEYAERLAEGNEHIQIVSEEGVR